MREYDMYMAAIVRHIDDAVSLMNRAALMDCTVDSLKSPTEAVSALNRLGIIWETLPEGRPKWESLVSLLDARCLISEIVVL